MTSRTIDERKAEHLKKLKDGTYFHNAILKYGINNFKIEVIDTATCIEELREKEKMWIKNLNSFSYIKGSNGYNQTLGGSGCLGLYGELNSQYGISIIERMGDRYNDYLKTIKETRIKGEDHWCFGKHPREWFGEDKWDKKNKEQSLKWSGDNNPNRINPKRGKDHSNYGKVFSTEVRMKMAKGHKNKKLTEGDALAM